MKKLAALFLGLALIVGCGGDPEPAKVDGDGDGEVVTAPDVVAAPDAAPKADAMWADGSSYPDSEIGLSTGTVFDILTPDSFAFDASEPGDRPCLVRGYATSPPRIPHGIGDMDPITLDENLCVECHDGVDGKAMSTTHTSGAVGGELVGMRYNCTACHVPQTNAKPLVGNVFVD